MSQMALTDECYNFASGGTILIGFRLEKKKQDMLGKQCKVSPILFLSFLLHVGKNLGLQRESSQIY